MSANFLTTLVLFVAANPSCDGHFENPSTEKDATPPPFGISWMGSELIVIGIPNLVLDATFWKLLISLARVSGLGLPYKLKWVILSNKIWDSVNWLPLIATS